MLSILFIASVNIWSIYIFYNSYIKIYLEEKIQSRDVITLEYINEVIRRQTVDEIDSIFNDTEVLFYELLEEWNWTIFFSPNGLAQWMSRCSCFPVACASSS